MRILILGDSYADDRVRYSDIVTWVDRLRQDHTVTNLAMSGSSLIYSLRIYEEQVERYDRCIFMVTQPGRLRLRKSIHELTEYTQPSGMFIPNVATCDFVLAQTTHTFTRTIYSLAKEYWLFLANEEDDRMIQKLCLDRLRSETTLLIPCFVNSLEQPSKWNLWKISKLEQTALEFPDKRTCHFNRDNHLWLYERIRQWLAGNGFSLDPAAQL